LTSNTLEQQIVLSLEEAAPPLSIQTLAELSKLFSRIIDFRSSFTALHSSGVAAVAERIAQYQGLTSDQRLLIKISGNLHDIGKLSVPREILEKRDMLSPSDKNIIKSHSYHTYQVLAPLKNLGEVRTWASFHHERPDGNGYPFHVKGDGLDEGCRIVAIADIFTALTENRPYRTGMGRNAIRNELTAMAGLKQIDSELTTLVSDCYEDLTGTCLEAKEKSLSEYLSFRGSFDTWSRQARN
jgi:HD-GYP domain-containing protein (c-di-GMP phosphodiesterase class II)